LEVIYCCRWYWWRTCNTILSIGNHLLCMQTVVILWTSNRLVHTPKYSSRWHLMLSCINRHERYLWRFARFPVWDRTVYMDSIVLQVRHLIWKVS
jgi:hypothetical protein